MLTQTRDEDWQEILRHIQSVLLPGCKSKLLIALVTVVNSDPKRCRKFKLSQVQRLCDEA